MDSTHSKCKLTVAVLDDEPIVRRSLVRFLNIAGIQTKEFSSPFSFLEGCLHEYPDCAILDLHMPMLSGIDVLERLRSCNIEFPVIVLTANDDNDVRLKCRALGVDCFILKPVDGHMLLTAIDSVTSRATPVSSTG
jgi:two-component system, LuxR family, response regulator FixJ